MEWEDFFGSVRELEFPLKLECVKIVMHYLHILDVAVSYDTVGHVTMV